MELFLSVRILGGDFKGHSLIVPSHKGVRPTSVLLRRKIFDVFQNLEGMNFVDACAGTGAMGLEAYSRGASKVWLIEKEKQFYSYCQKNAGLFHQKHSDRLLECICSPIEKWFPVFKDFYLRESDFFRKNTFFFFDPPYKNLKLYEEVNNYFFQDEFWFQGIYLLEVRSRKGLKSSLENFISKSYSHGDREILIFDFTQN